MTEVRELVLATSLPPELDDVIAGYEHAPSPALLKTYESFDVSGDSPEMQAAQTFREQQKQAFLADDIRNPQLNNCPNFWLQRNKRRDMYLSAKQVLLAQQLRYADGAPQTLEDRELDTVVAMTLLK